MVPDMVISGCYSYSRISNDGCVGKLLFFKKPKAVHTTVLKYQKELKRFNWAFSLMSAKHILKQKSRTTKNSPKIFNLIMTIPQSFSSEKLWRKFIILRQNEMAQHLHWWVEYLCIFLWNAFKEKKQLTFLKREICEKMETYLQSCSLTNFD